MLICICIASNCLWKCKLFLIMFMVSVWGCNKKGPDLRSFLGFSSPYINLALFFYYVSVHDKEKGKRNVKTCVPYFLSNFYFFTKWQLFKNYEKCFLFHLKSSFRSRDIQFFVIFSLPFHTFLIQKDKWKCNNLWCHELICMNLQMQFLQ